MHLSRAHFPRKPSEGHSVDFSVSQAGKRLEFNHDIGDLAFIDTLFRIETKFACRYFRALLEYNCNADALTKFFVLNCKSAAFCNVIVMRISGLDFGRKHVDASTNNYVL